MVLFHVADENISLEEFYHAVDVPSCNFEGFALREACALMSFRVMWSVKGGSFVAVVVSTKPGGPGAGVWVPSIGLKISGGTVSLVVRGFSGANAGGALGRKHHFVRGSLFEVSILLPGYTSVVVESLESSHLRLYGSCCLAIM